MKLTVTIKVYYSPTNAQVIVLKTILKVYIKIAPTCFGAVTPFSGGSCLLKLHFIKIVNYGLSVSELF
jgi:hypothetical protein